MTVDEKYMHRCLQLALIGTGQVAPNPMVGAVLVYNDTIIAEGFHQHYGQAHAEVNCINAVSKEQEKLLSKSTLYVSLEPCAHYGKTPPCTDLIIKNNIPKVVIGCPDSYKQVAGKGIEKLKTAGVQVTVGVLQKEALELNKRFFTFHQKQRPYIILKWAQSHDNKIGGLNHQRTFISNDISNRLVHQWRSEEASILVGTNTALIDNPSLTTRLVPGKNSVRLVIDMDLKLSTDLQLFDKTVKTMVFNGVKEEVNDRISFFKIDRNNISQLLEILYKQNIQSILVEGGAKLLQSFIDADLWDEARVITNADLIIGEGVQAPQLNSSIVDTKHIFGSDRVVFYLNDKL
ncbi:MAG: bifunctional diaminohydroxyphosphoribosylaminopyrimidine deaminase/5-amino-6-(5-phosphoribosylamino)uracil reductase RibD [Ferruginibacter sp.]